MAVAAALGATATPVVAAPSTPFESSATDLYSTLEPAQVAERLSDPALGSDLVNSIPGVSTDFTQATQSIQALPNGNIVATFVCPAPLSSSTPLLFRAVELKPGNAIDANFCPSLRRIHFSVLNRNDAAFDKAVRAFRADRYRNEPYYGQWYRYNVFTICPDMPKQFHLPYMKVSKGQVRLTYFNGTWEYCDKLGQFSRELTLQARRPGQRSYTTVGAPLWHIATMPNLLHAYSFPAKYATETVSMARARDICTARGAGKTRLRVVFTSRFRPYRGTTFSPDGPKIRSGAATRTTKPINAC